ncbi:MAG: cation transporter, partial [Nitrososphaeraceae archaeon]
MHIDRISFKIMGMYCTSCIPIVRKQLKDLKAIKQISVDYMTD